MNRALLIEGTGIVEGEVKRDRSREKEKTLVIVERKEPKEERESKEHKKEKIDKHKSKDKKKKDKKHKEKTIRLEDLYDI